MAVTTTVLVGVAIGSQVAQYDQQKKAQKAQREANELERRKQAIAQQRERRKAIADRQRAQASQEAQGVAQGIEGSSAVLGAQSSVGSQTASNLGFASAVNQITTTQSELAQRASNHQYRAGLYSALSNLSTQAGFAALSSMPAKPTTTTQVSSGTPWSIVAPTSATRYTGP